MGKVYQSLCITIYPLHLLIKCIFEVNNFEDGLYGEPQSKTLIFFNQWFEQWKNNLQYVFHKKLLFKALLFEIQYGYTDIYILKMILEQKHKTEQKCKVLQSVA